MFQCAAEPWWAFEASAKAMAREFKGLAHAEPALMFPERFH